MAMRRTTRCSTVSFSTSEPEVSCVRSRRRCNTEPAGECKQHVRFEAEQVQAVPCLPSLLTGILGKKQVTRSRALSFREERSRAFSFREERSRPLHSPEPGMCHVRSEEGSSRAPRGILRKGPAPGSRADRSLPAKPRSASRVSFSTVVSVADVQFADMKGSPKRRVSCDSFRAQPSAEAVVAAELEDPNPEMAFKAEADEVIRCSSEWCDDDSEASGSDSDLDVGGRGQRLRLNRPRSRSYKDLEELVQGCTVVAAM